MLIGCWPSFQPVGNNPLICRPLPVPGHYSGMKVYRTSLRYVILNSKCCPNELGDENNLLLKKKKKKKMFLINFFFLAWCLEKNRRKNKFILFSYSKQELVQVMDQMKPLTEIMTRSGVYLALRKSLGAPEPYNNDILQIKVFT